MDVEKLRKVNQLSAELRRHNMADSSDAAFEQAEQMVRQDEVREFLHRAKESTKTVENPSSDQLYQVHLERENRRLGEYIQKIAAELQQLKADVDQLRQAPRAPQQAQQTIAPPKAEQQATLAAKKEEPHPKQGEFNSEDVSIEKMFYFGNK